MRLNCKRRGVLAQMRQTRIRSGFTLIELMIVIAIISILALIFSVNVIRARAKGQYTGCVSNLKNMGASLQMYATDNSQRFPTTLSGITPSHMRSLPTCPSVNGSYPYVNGFASASNPDRYTLMCAGSPGNHRGVGDGANYPQYTLDRGLVEQ